MLWTPLKLAQTTPTDSASHPPDGFEAEAQHTITAPAKHTVA
ncbi:MULTISPECIES: hypothetical protein [Cyanophyceae]|nr:hypothetical protein [Phormidium sp. FACHB-592]